MRLRLIIRGRVQGVGYRWWLQETALRRNLQGWVRNCPDGAVEAELIGPEPDVEAVATLCASGPPAARVTEVERQLLSESGLSVSGFHIRR
ncbi:MAG TPA: acylphosphatase [Candidatus Hydrogenedentes bacterium]|nr:acylphosphatase [Candidatus Hydrogenedentota bacterium]HOK89920.1 acylphosphatase [Candidatus Hydrogenedentota bacterium]